MTAAIGVGVPSAALQSDRKEKWKEDDKYDLERKGQGTNSKYTVFKYTLGKGDEYERCRRRAKERSQALLENVW